MSKKDSLKVSLLSLRYGVGIVMVMWTLDKFVNPEHAAKVFSFFYKIGGLGNTAIYAIGALQLAVVGAFLLGIKKKWSYGAIFALHAISTFSSFAMYLDPWGPRNLLFFAAWPMLAACFALYQLKEVDTIWTVN
jgi:putative oxidoreductase